MRYNYENSAQILKIGFDEIQEKQSGRKKRV
jgi:hypothetical protein